MWGILPNHSGQERFLSVLSENLSTYPNLWSYQESYIPNSALLYTIIYYSKMLILKHLKTLQHVSIIIQIIFRELVGSLLKSLNLKIFKNVTGQLWWCDSITFGVYVRTRTHTHTHTPNVATHASTCWRVCGNNLNIVSMCAVSPVVHTSKISSCQKGPFSLFLWLWTIPLR